MDWTNVIYQKATETIRQMPENYLLAHRTFGRWVCDPDIAANQKISSAIFLELFNYEYRYGSGEKLLETLNSKRL